MDLPTEAFSFNKIDNEILSFWESSDIFQKSLNKNKHKPLWTFLDGPPFINGSMHSGHVLVSYVKDTVIRYKSMEGFYIPRTIGYDCHGLPLEQAAEKELGMSTKDAVTKLGVKGHNDVCRKIIAKCTNTWEDCFKRLGRWTDTSVKYKTMDTPFMETEWWAFQTLYNKGLVYKGLKIMPYSTKCTTSLSNFEANLNYKDVTDQTVIVAMPLTCDNDNPKTYMLVWTSTPWTLISNVAICVNQELTYCKVHDKKKDVYYIVAKNLFKDVFNKYKPVGTTFDDYVIIEEFSGKELIGLRYTPLFDYFPNSENKNKQYYSIVGDPYVTADSGTGCVHLSPNHGVDDYRVCLKFGIVDKFGNHIANAIDEQGNYMDFVELYAGRFALDCTKDIIRQLDNEGKMFCKYQYTHSYPHCYRTDTPLIYKAVSAWFINVEKLAEDIIRNTKEGSTWMPQSVKDTRFLLWLENAQDWCVSRTRYWGTSIPLWVSDDGEEIVCIGSIDELEKLTNVTGITDLHKESVDHLTISSKRGKEYGVLKRIPEIFDCWYESGLCGIASHHYPFENKEYVEEHYPVDFITESLDQTRGWFYTLMVLSTALFNKPAFKNVIVTGLILAEDGQKMSKRLSNYTDPMLLVDKFGSDAMRLYLISSPVVRAEPFAFKDEGVKDIIKKLLPWYNGYKFFMECYIKFTKTHCKFNKPVHSDGSKYVFPIWSLGSDSENISDIWIKEELNSLIVHIRDDMNEFKLYKVLPQLLTFIENLTNWYIKLNRDRLKGNYNVRNTNDCLDNWMDSLKTLFDVLMKFNVVMAPFCPFFTEYLHQQLKELLPQNMVKESIHLYDYPKVEEEGDENIIRQMHCMQEIIENVRKMKQQNSIPMAKFVKNITICCDDDEILNDMIYMSKYLKSELSIIDLKTCSLNKYVTVTIEPIMSTIGKQFRKEAAHVAELIRTSSIVDLFDELVEYNDVQIDKTFYKVSSDKKSDEENGLDKPTLYSEHYPTLQSIDASVMIIIDIEQTQDVKSLNVVQEFRRMIQTMRKEMELYQWNPIKIYYDTDDTDLISYVKKHKKLLKEQVVYDIILLKDLDEFTTFDEFKLKYKSKWIGDKKIMKNTTLILVRDE
jgi:isoleucyl-tRNA synthetase